MTQEQHKIFINLVNIFLKYIPLGDIAAKGLGWKSISRWQIEHKRDLLGLINETPEERIKSMNQLSEVIKNEVIAILEDPEQKSLVDNTINEIMEYYKREHAYH